MLSPQAAAPKSKAPRTLPVEASAASSLFDSRAVHNSRFDLKQRSSISHLDAQVAPGSAAPAATLLSFDVLASSVSDKSLAMAAPLHAVAGAAAVAAAVSAQPPVIINLITDAPVSYQATDVPRWDATAVMRRAFDFSYNDRVASTLTSRVASDRSHARYPFLVSLEPFEGDTVSSFTVKFSVDNTFALLGVVDAYERTLNNSECYLHDFCRFPLLYSTATHPDDGWNLITIDMTRREFRVKRLSSGEVVVRSGLPERVWFAAVFKAEYECMITLAGALDGHASTE